MQSWKLTFTQVKSFKPVSNPSTFTMTGTNGTMQVFFPAFACLSTWWGEHSKCSRQYGKRVTNNQPCVVFPPRAQSYAERLRLGLAVIHGEAQCSESDMADGRHSPPCVRNTTGHTGLELPCKNHRLSVAFLSVATVSPVFQAAPPCCHSHSRRTSHETRVRILQKDFFVLSFFFSLLCITHDISHTSRTGFCCITACLNSCILARLLTDREWQFIITRRSTFLSLCRGFFSCFMQHTLSWCDCFIGTN